MKFAAMCMDLENITLGEVSPTENDKYCIISLMCRIQKIIQMNVYSRKEDSQI